MKTNKPLLGEERVRKEKDREENSGQKEGGRTLQKEKQKGNRKSGTERYCFSMLRGQHGK